jgi:hypothetical protein
MVSLLKLGLDSLLVNLVMWPIDFEKIKPSALSGDINSAKSQIFNGNHFQFAQSCALERLNKVII